MKIYDAYSMGKWFLAGIVIGFAIYAFGGINCINAMLIPVTVLLFLVMGIHLAAMYGLYKLGALK